MGNFLRLGGATERRMKIHAVKASVFLSALIIVVYHTCNWITSRRTDVGTIYFGWLPLYLPELFPTTVRATGTGISFNTGRVVAAIVVLCTGVLVRSFGGDYARIGLWTGMIYAAGMVIIVFAPRTSSANLKD